VGWASRSRARRKLARASTLDAGDAEPRRGGRSGNARQSTPTAPLASAVRQATRALSERPPTISGNRSNMSSRRCSTTAVQTTSSRVAGGGSAAGDAVGLSPQRRPLTGELTGEAGQEIPASTPSLCGLKDRYPSLVGSRVEPLPLRRSRKVLRKRLPTGCPQVRDRQRVSACGTCSPGSLPANGATISLVLAPASERYVRKVATCCDNVELELWILIDELGESSKLVATMVELIKVEIRTWDELVLDVLKHNGRGAIQVGIQHHHEELMIGPVVMGQCFVEPSDHEANARIINLGGPTAQREITTRMSLESPVMG
jgi:hypothetical protein